VLDVLYPTQLKLLPNLGQISHGRFAKAVRMILERQYGPDIQWWYVCKQSGAESEKRIAAERALDHLTGGAT